MTKGRKQTNGKGKVSIIFNKAPPHEDVCNRGGKTQAILTSAANEAEWLA
jgi:hypothetical protein